MNGEQTLARHLYFSFYMNSSMLDLICLLLLVN